MPVKVYPMSPGGFTTTAKVRAPPDLLETLPTIDDTSPRKPVLTRSKPAAEGSDKRWRAEVHHTPGKAKPSAAAAPDRF